MQKSGSLRTNPTIRIRPPGIVDQAVWVIDPVDMLNDLAVLIVIKPGGELHGFYLLTIPHKGGEVAADHGGIALDDLFLNVKSVLFQFFKTRIGPVKEFGKLIPALYSGAGHHIFQHHDLGIEFKKAIEIRTLLVELDEEIHFFRDSSLIFTITETEYNKKGQDNIFHAPKLVCSGQINLKCLILARN